MRFRGCAWTQTHERWLRTLSFDHALSRATFIDYWCAVQALVARRAALIAVLEQAVPDSSHAPVIARLRCFRGIDTLSAAGLCAEVGNFGRFAKPNLLSGYLGIVPSEYTSDSKRVQGQITKAGPTHARRLLVEAAHHYRRRPAISQGLATRQAGQDPRVDPDRLARAASSARPLGSPRRRARQADRHRRGRVRARARRVLLGGSHPGLTPKSDNHQRAPAAAGARTSITKAVTSPPTGPRLRYGQPSRLAGPRPFLDCEPGDEQGS